MVDVNTQFGGFLTDLGAAKNANANALGVPWKLTHMLIGDASGTDPVPAPGQTALVNQVYRAQLNQLYVSPTDANVLIAELVLPPNVGGWWIRELALEDEDGVFSAVANCAPSYKPVLAQGSGRNQVVRMHVITSGTANIQLKIDPSVVLATRAYCDGLIAAHGAAANPHPQYELRGAVTNIAANTALTAAQLGLVHADATAAAVTATLPPSNAALGVRDVIIRRTDNTGNRLTVRVTGDDKIKFHTHLRAEGYPFLMLMGAGDWWHLRSDGEGSWWPIGRKDDTPLGLLDFAAASAPPPGGYGFPHGTLLIRSEWPWLIDFVASSGALVNDSDRVGNEGCWTWGNGATTFRTPDVRAEFFRAADYGRGVDVSRTPGSHQADQLRSHTHELSGGNQTATTATALDLWAKQQGYTLQSGATGGDETRPRNLAFPVFIKLI